MFHAAGGLGRHPLAGFLRNYWWVPALATLEIGLLAGGRWGFAAACVALGVEGGLAAGILGRAWLRAERHARRTSDAHWERGERFLCPNCLCFEAFRFACP